MSRATLDAIALIYPLGTLLALAGAAAILKRLGIKDTDGRDSDVITAPLKE